MSVSWKGSTVKIINQINRGVSAARNAGIDNAAGEYLLFIDPDDTVMPDYIATISEELSGDDCDFLLFGYRQIIENDDGFSDPVDVLPKKEYHISSTDQAISDLLPNFFGRSLMSIDHWLKTGVFNPYQEDGMVWRCAYRRSIICANGIRFRENIQLREDDIFNCEYISRIQTGKTCMKPIYVYALRKSGAVRKNWGNALLKNTVAVLEAREQICADLQTRGYEQVSYLWYVGSTVFSVFGILKIVDYSQWKKIKQYIQHQTVRKSIQGAPVSLRKPVYCAMILLLKLRLHMLLLLCYKVCGRLNIKFNICK